jgi:orotate phosphoribosyltransferase
MNYEKELIYFSEILLDYEVIKTSFHNPIQFKSGIQSPIYCDLRKLLTYPTPMELCAKLIAHHIPQHQYQTIAGVATGALPIATLVSHELGGWRMCYVRPGAQEKDYGTKNLIEGSSIYQDNVYLIEDVLSTGSSILNDARIIKQAGAFNVFPIAIFSYGMNEAKENFKQAEKNGICHKPRVLITLKDILPLLKRKLSTDNYSSLLSWMKNPKEWQPMPQ